MSTLGYWSCVWQHIDTRPGGFVSFCKVPAHKDVSVFPVNSWEAWAAYWNNKVDLLAKNVILQTHQQVFHEAKREYSIGEKLIVIRTNCGCV